MYLEDMVTEFYFTKLSLNRENLTNQTIFKDTPDLPKRDNYANIKRQINN